MSAHVIPLAPLRQQRGLPPARPIPPMLSKGDRVRVPKLGFAVGYIESGYLNAAGTEMVYVVVAAGVRHILEARDIAGDDGPQGPRAA